MCLEKQILFSIFFLVTQIGLAQPNPDTAVINQIGSIAANKNYNTGKPFSYYLSSTFLFTTNLI